MNQVKNYLYPPHQCGHVETPTEKSARNRNKLIASIFASTVVATVAGLAGCLLIGALIPVGLAAAGASGYWAGKAVDALHHQCPMSIDKHTVIREAIKTCMVAAASLALGCIMAIPLSLLGMLIAAPFTGSSVTFHPGPIIVGGLIGWYANNALIGATATKF